MVLACTLRISGLVSWLRIREHAPIWLDRKDFSTSCEAHAGIALERNHGDQLVSVPVILGTCSAFLLDVTAGHAPISSFS